MGTTGCTDTKGPTQDKTMLHGRLQIHDSVIDCIKRVIKSEVALRDIETALERVQDSWFTDLLSVGLSGSPRDKQLILTRGEKPINNCHVILFITIFPQHYNA